MPCVISICRHCIAVWLHSCEIAINLYHIFDKCKRTLSKLLNVDVICLPWRQKSNNNNYYHSVASIWISSNDVNESWLKSTNLIFLKVLKKTPIRLLYHYFSPFLFYKFFKWKGKQRTGQRAHFKVKWALLKGALLLMCGCLFRGVLEGEQQVLDCFSLDFKGEKNHCSLSLSSNFFSWKESQVLFAIVSPRGIGEAFFATSRCHNNSNLTLGRSSNFP